MSKEKLRLSQMAPDLLASTIRGEIGEIVVTWILLRNLMLQRQRQGQNQDPRESVEDLRSPNTTTLSMLISKLSDEIVARLSELGEPKVGQVTFHLASKKLGRFDKDAQTYTRFIKRSRFKEKRDSQISHKEAPISWDDLKFIDVSYRTLLKGVAAALRLMKKIDRAVLGPSAPYLWRRMRERRYEPLAPPSAAYGLLPYLFLSKVERAAIIREEMQEGYTVWEAMPATVEGKEVAVPACRKWGAIILGEDVLILDAYPLHAIGNIGRRRTESETASE